MRARATFVIGSTLLAALVWAVPASAGGGGCHEEATHGTGDVVAIEQGCFTPSILHVARDTPVTFVNEDPYEHNVSANGWGHLDPLRQGDRFTVTFDADGLYPFACMIHEGMTGTIVVGDGNGAGNGASNLSDTTAAELAAAEELVTAAVPLPVPADDGVATGPVAAALAIGVAAGLGIAAIRRRATVDPR